MVLITKLYYASKSDSLGAFYIIILYTKSQRKNSTFIAFFYWIYVHFGVKINMELLLYTALRSGDANFMPIVDQTSIVNITWFNTRRK